MSVHNEHTNAFSGFPSSTNIYPEDIKNIDIWFTAKVFNIHEKYTETDKFRCFIFRLSYRWSNRRPSSSGKWQCTLKSSLLSSSHCPFTIKTSSQVSVSPTSFLQTSHVVCYCVVVLISGPLREEKKKKCSNGWIGWCPVHVWGYTPSSMPMKSEPFCIVMEAPAALSTNMEVYCPACRGKYISQWCRKISHTYRYFMYCAAHLQLQQPLHADSEYLAVTF